jgi:uncharacterized protein YifE (UPF0438 family)
MNELFRLYIDLDTGVRKPQTDAQRHFVKVCRGEAAPETPQERSYLHIRAVRESQPAVTERHAGMSSVPRRDFGPREWDRYEYNKCK